MSEDKDDLMLLNAFSAAKARYLAKLGYDPLAISMVLGCEESFVKECLGKNDSTDVPVELIKLYEETVRENRELPEEESVAADLAQVGMPEEGSYEEYIDSIFLLNIFNKETLEGLVKGAEYFSRNDIGDERQLSLAKILKIIHEVDVEALSTSS